MQHRKHMEDVHGSGTLFSDLTLDAQDRSVQTLEVYLRIQWTYFGEAALTMFKNLKEPDCGCVILEFDKLEPEVKWVLWRKHVLVHDHEPTQACPDCGVLAFKSMMKVHRNFNCKDNKAQALHSKKPYHKVFDQFNHSKKMEIKK